MPGIHPEDPSIRPISPRFLHPSEICIAEISDPETLNIYSLVLSAANINHRVHILSNNHMEIYVIDSIREKALYEITAYRRENSDISGPKNIDTNFIPTFRAMAPLLIGGLVLMYSVSGDWQPDSHWFVKGAGDSRAILQDFEFYRLVTPLTLHADLIHLLSNCIFGMFLLHFFLHLTGNGIGLAALLITAATANFCNIIIHGPGHIFVGFSTATFSIIGMLCTMNYIGKSPHFRWHFLMPIMAGLALLAFLGSSGEKTDLGGHLFGLLCGLISGNLVRSRFFTMFRTSFMVQSLLGITAFTVLLGCWMVALAR